MCRSLQRGKGSAYESRSCPNVSFSRDHLHSDLSSEELPGTWMSKWRWWLQVYSWLSLKPVLILLESEELPVPWSPSAECLLYSVEKYFTKSICSLKGLQTKWNIHQLLFGLFFPGSYFEHPKLYKLLCGLNRLMGQGFQTFVSISWERNSPFMLPRFASYLGCMKPQFYPQHFLKGVWHTPVTPAFSVWKRRVKISRLSLSI